MNAFAISVLIGLGAVMVAPADAAILSMSRTDRPVTAAEISDGAPFSGIVHEFFVTSESDILSVTRVVIDRPLFQHAAGSDVAQPLPMLPGFGPALGRRFLHQDAGPNRQHRRRV